MGMQFINRRGEPLDAATVDQLIREGRHPDQLTSHRGNPARVLERLQRDALRAWHSEIDCPPELFHVADRATFVQRYVAMFI